MLEDVHNNNFSQSTSNPVLSHTSVNEGNVVASLPNNSEEPLPVEPQSAPVIIQVSVTHSVVYLPYKVVHLLVISIWQIPGGFH